MIMLIILAAVTFALILFLQYNHYEENDKEKEK